MLKLLSIHYSMIHMKIYNKIDVNEMEAMVGFEPAHDGKKNGFYAVSVSIY